MQRCNLAKALSATCENGIVKVGDLIVDDAIILSLGTAPTSTGVLFIEGAASYFVASSATDIQALIENLVAIIDKIILISTGLDAVTVSPGGQAANIVQLSLLKVQLDLTKDTLI